MPAFSVTHPHRTSLPRSAPVLQTPYPKFPGTTRIYTPVKYATLALSACLSFHILLLSTSPPIRAAP